MSDSIAPPRSVAQSWATSVARMRSGKGPELSVDNDLMAQIGGHRNPDPDIDVDARVLGKICAAVEIETVSNLVWELVVDVIKDATDKFLSIKRHEHRVNPVVAIILELVEAACAELIRPIAVEVALFSTIITLLLIVIVNM
jgi:hypothetical protein